MTPAPVRELHRSRGYVDLYNQLENFRSAMDTHGLTWTKTFIHARPGMSKIPNACGRNNIQPGGSYWLPEISGGPCQSRQIVYVGPCGSMAEYTDVMQDVNPCTGTEILTILPVLP